MTVKLKYFIVDAFTDTLFGGNPAGVCILDRQLDPSLMQSIAAENNLAETAFVMKNGNEYALRWFTPTNEVDLCGHATLATAFVIKQFIDESTDSMVFQTASGALTVEQKGDLFEMDFPARKLEPMGILSAFEKTFNVPILEAWRSRDIILLLETEEQVRNIVPDFDAMRKITDCLGVAITSKGRESDFVCRFFAPNVGVLEDPVTGSVHSSLIPFWAERLNKESLVSHQLSKRGGKLFCRNAGDRVKIAGKAVPYLRGEIVVK